MQVNALLGEIENAFEVSRYVDTLAYSTRMNLRRIRFEPSAIADAAVIANEWVKRIERYRDMAASIRDKLAIAAGD